MQKYVNQLLVKMEQASKDPSQPIDPKILYPDHPSMAYPGLEYIAEWELGQKTPAEELFEISKDEFPSADKLNTTQIESLIDGLHEMIQSINNSISLPDEMPPARKYELIIGLWDEGFQPLTTGTSCNDFCTGYAPDCELEEYCSCKEIWEELDD